MNLEWDKALNLFLLFDLINNEFEPILLFVVLLIKEWDLLVYKDE